MKKILFILGLFWVGTIGGDPAQAMSLTEVVNTVLHDAPPLKSAQAGVEQAQNQVREVQSNRYPHIQVRSTYMRGNNPVYVFGSLLEQQAFGPQNFAIDALNHPGSLTNIKTALDVGVPLFTGFELSSVEKLQKWNVELARSDFQHADQMVRMHVVELALFVLLKQALLEEMSNRLSSAEKEIESAKKLNAKGLVLGSDYFAAQAIFSAFSAHKLQWQNELIAAKEKLRQMMKAPNAPAVDGQLVSAIYKIPRQDELTTAALSTRPEIKKSEVALRMTEERYRQSRRSFLPSLEAFGSLETNTDNFASNPNNHTWGVRSQFPIGDPAYRSRTKVANAMVKGAQGQYASMEDQIKMDVIEARHALQAVQESLPALEMARQQAEKSLALFRPLYREGRQSILDVLRAEEGLLKAQEAYLGLLSQLHVRYAKLHWVLGQLDQRVIQDIQSRLEVRP